VNFETATPVEIDTPLAAIYERIYDLQFDLVVNENRLASHLEGLAKYQAGDFRYSSYSQETVNRLNEKSAQIEAAIAAARVETLPYEAEFVRRGGWTRAWLVDNTGGHVHSSMHCSTCFDTTRFGWLPQVSGFDEAEIVAQAGEKACTICYPSAPAEVLNNPSALELPRRREERLAREAEKAADLAAKAIKSLSIDGTVVKVHWTYEGTNWRTDEAKVYNASKDLKTYRGAELFVVNAMASQDGVDRDTPPQHIIDEVIGMMAAKKDLDPYTLTQNLILKSETKRAKNMYA
jgi:hypothetical protein